MGRIRSAGRLALVEPTQAQPTTQPTQPTTQPTTRRPVGRPRGPRKAPRSKRPDPELVSIRPLAVSVLQAAKMLSVSKSTVYKAVMRGEIESFVVGAKTRRISVAVLERYVGMPLDLRTA